MSSDMQTTGFDEVTLDNFDFGATLGQGQNGAVHEARIIFASLACKRIPATNVVIKSIRNSQRGNAAAAGNEIEVLHRLKWCPQIVFLHSNFKEGDCHYLIMERLRGSNLERSIAEINGVSEEIALDIMVQVLGALIYMHERGYAHQDISLSNVVFTNEHHFYPRQTPPVKLIDFGATIRSRPGEVNGKRRSFRGNLFYAAPEVFTAENFRPNPVDIWSVGICLYTMIQGRHPFKGMYVLEMMGYVESGNVSFNAGQWGNVSNQTKEFILSCLCHNPEQRPSAVEAFSTISAVRSSISK